MAKRFFKILYIVYYAELLKTNPEVFDQQKRLIESQMRSSKAIFSKMFGKRSFKENAKRYLAAMGKL